MLEESQPRDEPLDSSSKQPKQVFSTVFPEHLISTNNMIRPVLNKVKMCNWGFFCGYSNGVILQYDFADQSKGQGQIKLREIHYPYQNCDIIDIDTIDDRKDRVLTCTHTEVTVLDLHKNKRLSLKGHEETPIAVSIHPVSPLVVSVSNLVIQHDLRCQKPILVNYVTPPVYGIEYFPDGQFYFLSGEPCRIGTDKWMRTLENGIGKVSCNSKFVLTNAMNGEIVMWDWKQSKKLRTLKGIKNQQNYQQIHWGVQNRQIDSLMFLEDDGNLLKHHLASNTTEKSPLLNISEEEIWKSEVNKNSQNTKYLLAYEHESTQIKCFEL